MYNKTYNNYFSSLYRADYSVVTTVIPDNFRNESRTFEYPAYSLSLFFSDFNCKKSSASELSCPHRYQSAIKIQTVLTAEKRKLRLVPYFLLQGFHIRIGDIRRI